MLGECVSPKKTGRYWCRCFLQDGSKWRGSRVRSSDCVGFGRPDLLLRLLMLHMARGYSLRETVVRAKLANWANISDVASLKHLRKSEEWLRLLCIGLIRENVAYRLEGSPTLWVVQPLREAWPYTPAHRFLLFDRDAKFGDACRSLTRSPIHQP